MDGATGEPLSPVHTGGGGELAAFAAVAARCPRWEPLKEALVWGEADNATLGGAGWHNPLVEVRLAAVGEAKGSHRFLLKDFLTGRRRARRVDGPAAAEPWVHFQTAIQTPPARPLFSHWWGPRRNYSTRFILVSPLSMGTHTAHLVLLASHLLVALFALHHS